MLLRRRNRIDASPGSSFPPASAEPDPEVPRAGHIAGYRVLRTLAVGARGTLLLARSFPGSGTDERAGAAPLRFRGGAGYAADGAAEGAVEGSAAQTARSPVVIKLFHDHTTDESIDAEIAALCRASSPHVVRLMDIASVAGRHPCLVFERLNGPSLAGHLGAVERMTLGEAVTIAAAVCQTVQFLHDRGVAHGRLGTAKVLFDDRGAPVITGFGCATLRAGPDPGTGLGTSPRAPAAPRTSAEAAWRGIVLADQRATLALASAVLERTAGADAVFAAGRARFESLLGRGPAHGFLPLLEEWLFELSEGAPVALHRAELRAPAVSRIPARAIGMPATPLEPEPFDWPEEEPGADEHVPPDPAILRWLRAAGVPDGVIEAVRAAYVRMPRSSRSARRGHPPGARPDHEPDEVGRSAAPPRRRPRPRAVFLGAAGAIVLTVLGVLAIPSGGEPGAGSAATASGSAPGNTASPASSEAPTATASAAQGEALNGDDPAAAFRALSALREACFAARSVDCLGLVDQRDSAAEQRDRSALLAAQADQPVAHAKLAVPDSVIAQTAGNSVILSATSDGKPASVLLLKGEAGWRIREVFEQQP